MYVLQNAASTPGRRGLPVRVVHVLDARENRAGGIDARPERWDDRSIGCDVRCGARRRRSLSRTYTATDDCVVRAPSAIQEAIMEWTCARCGQVARAADWTLLLSMGWRITPDDEFRCVVCAKRMLARASFHPLSAKSDTAARRQATVA
jgi:hypothetical protein